SWTRRSARRVDPHLPGSGEDREVDRPRGAEGPGDRGAGGQEHRAGHGGCLVADREPGRRRRGAPFGSPDRARRPFPRGAPARGPRRLGSRGAEQALEGFYREVPSISIDYAVMERSKRTLVVRAGFSWDDLGSWQAIGTPGSRDSSGNVVQGKVLLLDSENVT